MAEDATLSVSEMPEGSTPLKRVLIGFGAVALALAVIALLGLQALNTGPGRDFLARQLHRIAPQSGLTVAVGRLEGSLYGRLTIHDLRLGDPQGVFLSAPRVDLDWRPSLLIRRSLHISALTAPTVRWQRIPKLRKSEREGPILPDFDIYVGRLLLERVIIEPPVVGRRHVARVEGRANIHAGRALVDAQAVVLDGGDRLALKLDAEPDRNRFDLDAVVRAPAAGVLTRLLGLKQPLELTIAGDGNWSNWRGSVDGTLGNAALADLRLAASKGRFTLAGRAAPGLVVGGVVRTLSAPYLTIDAAAQFADRRFDVTLSAVSPAIRLESKGVLDLGEGAFEDMAVNVRLLRPAALLRRLTGRNIALAMTLDGPFARPTIDYVLTSPQMALATTVFDRLRIAGRVRIADGPLVIPATLTSARIGGVGAFLGGLLTNVRVEGPLYARGLLLSSNALRLRSDRVSGRAIASLDLRTGRYNVALVGDLPRYMIPGLGLVDVDADLRVVPSADGRNPHVRGRATARVIRMDNAFFRWLLEGQPRIVADLDIPPTGDIFFANARMISPGLTLTGRGSRARDGTFRIAANGRATRYGPVELRLVGPIDRPDIDLRLISPGFGVGLANVDVRLTPLPEGWALTAAGATSYGPATMKGRLITRPGQPLVVDVAALNAIGLTARGPLTQTGSAFTGNLDVTGSGVTGTLRLTPAEDVQRIEAVLAARNGRLELMGVPTSVMRGTLNGTLLLYPDAPAITARIAVNDLERGRLTIDEGNATVEYRAGRGRAAVVARGQQGVPFSADTQIAFAPERITVTGNGTVDREQVRLETPAQFDAIANGWRLAPVTLALDRGRAVIGGTFNGATAIDARLQDVGLGLLNFIAPDLELSGRATGTIDVAFPADGGLPQGRANLRIARFTRSGLAAVSLPVNISLNAAIENEAAAIRAVAQRRGQIIGRMQAQLRPIPGEASDPWAERLLAAPLVAQIRWNGPAGALWPLTGIEAFEFRGPVAITADLGGRLGEPTVRGLMRSQNLRLESTVLGTVVENLVLDSRFAGSRLELASFSGTAGKDGRISGSGNIDLSAIRGFPMDLRLQLANAQVLRRDDLRATVTGPMRITNGPDGGLIQGDLNINRARFRIGRPAAEAVPELPVRERNASLVRRTRAPQPAARPTIWRLDIEANANNDIEADGMGLESEWEAQLKLGGRADQPRVTGRAELIRGSYEFAGRRFELTRGLLQFEGGYPPNPSVDIAAEARVEGLTATLRIGGNAYQPEIAFSSIPALPEDEVLSRVLFGTSITNLSAPEALQLAGAVASLRGGTGANLDVFNVLRRGIGVDRLRILPGNTTTGRGASVAAGEYLGDRVYVEVATDAQGYTATQLEIGLTRSLSILSQIATQGGTSVNLRWSKDY